MVGISLNNIPCVDPKEIRNYCLENGLPTSWYGKPNKYVCPLGAEPGYGHLLFEESDYKELTRTTSAYTLRMQSQNGNRAFTGILIAGFPKNLTPGKKNPILMVEVTDTRSNAVKATNARYTWRDSPSSSLVTNEMTWLEAAEDLWNKNQFTQVFPGLPEDAHGIALTIEQYDCHGFKVISALEDLLTALGCVMNYDPTTDSYSISYAAGDTEDIVAFASKYRDGLIYEDIPFNSNPYFNYPDNVRVLFPVWSEDTLADPRMVYAKDIALDLSSVYGGSKGGTLILQDKQPLRVDSSGSMLNQTLIDDRADAVAKTFQDRMAQTTCKWPISRAYRGFIGGSEVDGHPGVMFDLIAWMDIGEGPMTAFLRQGISGTGELYDTASLPTAGLIEADHNPTMLFENGAAKRAMGLQPSQSRAKQNEGWWDDPTRDVIRLVGSGLGSYMMRTQSLRYGEYAQVSTGGRSDLRGRLYRPWSESANSGESANNTLRFFWVYSSVPAPMSSSAKYYIGYPLICDNIDPQAWVYGAAEYLVSANQETLQDGSRYLARKTDIANGFSGNYDGSYGTRRLWAAECCGNDGGGGPPLPRPNTPSDQQDLHDQCLTCNPIPKYIDIFVEDGSYGALTSTFTSFYIQAAWDGTKYVVPGTSSPDSAFYIAGDIYCVSRGGSSFEPYCFPSFPDYSNYFTFDGAMSGSGLPFSVVFSAGCLYFNQETPASTVVCSPFSFIILLYFGLVKLTVSKA